MCCPNSEARHGPHSANTSRNPMHMGPQKAGEGQTQATSPMCRWKCRAAKDRAVAEPRRTAARSLRLPCAACPWAAAAAAARRPAAGGHARAPGHAAWAAPRRPPSGAAQAGGYRRASAHPQNRRERSGHFRRSNRRRRCKVAPPRRRPVNSREGRRRRPRLQRCWRPEPL